MIFILEDDDNIRKLVCYALSKEGYGAEGFDKPSLFWKRNIGMIIFNHFSEQEKCCFIGNSHCLLHIVRNDNDSNL